MKVLLIGESSLDEYRYGYCKRLSPEAPVPIMTFDRLESKVGMAANVYKNIKIFNIDIDFLSNDCNKIVKRRFIDEKSKCQLLREDVEENLTPLNFQKNFNYDFIIISDYDKGLINNSFIENIINNYKGNIFVDTKRKDISVYKNCFIKINKNEFINMNLNPENSKIIITDGDNGSYYEGKNYPAPKVDVFDVTGAGDVFIACFSISYQVTKDMDFSIIFANNMASESVKHSGIYTINKNDIDKVINEICC
jgi:D-beta-D-heptose 7-phosphate kinase/D-beta-D-heptose 1-phosphate adenosyltransferase